MANDDRNGQNRFMSEAQFEALARKLSPVYFDRRDGSYWMRVNGKDQKGQVTSNILQLKNRSIINHLLAEKVKKSDGSMWQLTRDGIILGANQKQTEWPFYNAEKNNVVDYAGSLAGHRCGLRQEPNGKTYLITEEAGCGVYEDLPDKGEPEFFMEFITELLPGEQSQHFCYWLALALKSLRSADFRMGQCCIFAGEAQSGKSLLQDMITFVLGGRQADPFKYLFGETPFNYDLITAEHWMFADPPTTTDLKSRRLFGERLKEGVNNVWFRARKMQKDGEMVRLQRRVTGSINKRIEQLSQIPPMYDGTADKINLYNCNVVRKAFERFIVGSEQGTLKGIGQGTPAGALDKDKLWNTFTKEAPVLRSWLLRAFKNVPKRFGIDWRMGINPWHDLEILAAVNSLSFEERMLALFDSVYWDGPTVLRWDGRSDTFQRWFFEKFPAQSERIFRGEMDPATCGRYFAELKRHHPLRISDRKVDGYTVWTILAPSQTNEDKDNGIQE